MSGHKLDQALPEQLAIKSIDDILFEIGLCHHSVRETPNRNPLNRPTLILTVVSTEILMRTVSHFTDDNFILMITGEFAQYQSFKEVFNIGSIILSSMTLIMQFVYYLNYRRDIEPTFLRVFQMMSGTGPPNAVGLTDWKQVKQLLTIGKWMQPLRKNNLIIVPIVSAVFVLTFYIAHFGWTTALTGALYPALFTSIWGYYCFNILTIQLLMFYILCEYFILKLDKCNERLMNTKRINSRRIRNILRSFDDLYYEITEFNDTYWSKFLFVIWSTFGGFLVFMIHVILLVPVPYLIRIIAFYFTVIMIVLYFFIMTIASSVNHKANESYAIFNSFIIKFIVNKIVNYRRNTAAILKVSFN